MIWRTRFTETMAERRRFERGSIDWQYRTRVARKLVWLMRGVPVNEWRDE